MKVRDAADLGGKRHRMVAVGDQASQQLDILRIALREMIVGMAVIALGDRTVFAEVIEAGDQYLHAKFFVQRTDYGSARQRSTTILPASLPRSNARYCVCGVATITM